MPSIRIGFSTDFNLVGEQVGIGTTNPTARLEVAGQILADNASGSGGITTFTTYDGFLQSAQGIGNTVSIAETSKGNLNSLSGEIKISGEVTVTGDTPVAGGRLDSLTVTDSFDLPHGGSKDREDTPEKGTTRFNQDLGQLEFYTGLEWRTVGSYADTGGRGRAISGGGANPGNSDLIEYFSIATGGNATNFGTLTAVRNQVGGTSDGKRGIFAGGQPNTDIIDYITIASTGDAIDFGNLSVTRQDVQAVASSTRGVFGGGFTPGPNVAKNEIDYVEIQTTGNALDFGDLGNSGGWGMSAVQSPVRGVFLGGNPNRLQVIEFITIASLGNAVRFGDCDNNTGNYSSGASNSVRGIFAGGTPAGKISYVTIASEGNTSVFGDLTTDLSQAAAAATQTRFTYFGGRGNASPNPNLSQISYVTIATLGDHQEFGELSIPIRLQAGFSDSHGGLGGF